ncbi:MAG: signal peptidase II [Gemmatimonadetes bacterium]|nr:signal peptidase II [Gemmatimonadota bacterium]
MLLPPKARVFWPVLITWLLADCTTKDLAEDHLLPHVPEPVWGETVRWTLAYNPGAATGISLGEYSRVAFSFAAVIAVFVLFRLYRKSAPNAWVTATALALVIGGALGNLLDRIRSARGVVDFIDLGVGGWRFWTFNVADVGVFCGAVLLAWQLSREPDDTPAPVP